MQESRKAKDRESAVEQQIREAMERGAFDDLPGQGKPLDLTPNPYAQDRELAHKILKDAGCAPDWIELDKRIRAKQEEAKARLVGSRGRRQNSLRDLFGRTDAGALIVRERIEADWRAAVESYREDVTAINALVAELNLKVPSPRFQRYLVDVDRVLAHWVGSPE